MVMTNGNANPGFGVGYCNRRGDSYIGDLTFAGGNINAGSEDHDSAIGTGTVRLFSRPAIHNLVILDGNITPKQFARELETREMVTLT
jgi:hypothetical protein